MTNLTDDMRMICEVIGEDATRRLMRHLGGISIYIPKPGREEIAEALRRNAYNVKLVATMFKVSQNKVYAISKELREGLRQQQFDSRQRSLFDETEITNQ